MSVANMPPQTWVVRPNSSSWWASAASTALRASSMRSAARICGSTMNHITTAETTPAMAPAATPRHARALKFTPSSSGGGSTDCRAERVRAGRSEAEVGDEDSMARQAERVPAVVEELVKGHPRVVEHRAVLEDHPQQDRAEEGHGPRPHGDLDLRDADRDRLARDRLADGGVAHLLVPPCLVDSAPQPVSWLPDRRSPRLPGSLQWHYEACSPVTVARTTPESHRLPEHCGSTTLAHGDGVGVSHPPVHS